MGGKGVPIFQEYTRTPLRRTTVTLKEICCGWFEWLEIGPKSDIVEYILRSDDTLCSWHDMCH